jgi:hypothetical protein
VSGSNPYKFPKGPELDSKVHKVLFNGSEQDVAPLYSTDEKLASKVKSKIESRYGWDVITGRTRLREQPFFARYETGPSTSTEVVAETLALAVSRLALIVAQHHQDK